MNHKNKGSIEAWVPRSLIIEGSDVISAHCSSEGLCPLRLTWNNGYLQSIESATDLVDFPERILLPRFVEPHAHLDKAFTWKQFPNLSGTYEKALSNNLEEHLIRNSFQVRSRAQKALTIALKNGIRAVRTHIDSIGIQGKESWEVLKDLQIRWKSVIELQLVALVPIDYWGTGEGKLLARRVANEGGILGGVLAPPFDQRKCQDSLIELIKTANQLSCGIDLHIDESQTHPAFGLKLLINILDRFKSKISITCSHSSSMSLLPHRQLVKLAERMSLHNIKVIALPLTNAWLLARNNLKTPLKRPLAPIYQLQKAGVIVGIGGDNVKDPWFPLGGLDPLKLMAFSMPLTQLAPWQRLGLSPFINAPSEILDLKWNGTFRKGSPADWLLLESSSWVDALSLNSKRKVFVNGSLLDENMIPTS